MAEEFLRVDLGRAETFAPATERLELPGSIVPPLKAQPEEA
jgi:hypothetical protein